MIGKFWLYHITKYHCQRFHSYFHHMIFTNKLYSFDSSHPRCNYVSFPTNRFQSVDQVPPLLVIFLDDTWYTKGSHGPVCFSHQGANSGGGGVVTLNSSFISVEYNQILQLCFREQLRVLKTLINNPTKMMCYCS